MKIHFLRGGLCPCQEKVGMSEGKKTIYRGKRAVFASNSDLPKSRSGILVMPLQRKFDSLRRFAAGYGLTAKQLVRMAQTLEHHPSGEKKGVVGALHALAEQGRIPLGHLTTLAETLVYEQELEREVAKLRSVSSKAR